MPQFTVPSRRNTHTAWIVAVMFVAGTAAFHAHTYWWSESLQIADVTLQTDEGLVSLNLPLTRIAANETPAWGFTLYSRAPKIWMAGNARQAPLRSWMVHLGQTDEDWGVFADFGYWMGSWQSKSRPGPFIILFVPVWFLGLALFGGYLAVHFQIVRFRLRTLFIVMTLTACALFLLKLKDAL